MWRDLGLHFLCRWVSLGICSVPLPGYQPGSPQDEVAPRSAWNLPGYSRDRPSTCPVSFPPDETNLTGEVAMGNDKLPDSGFPVDSA